jgi:hypothetical protein
MEIDGVDGMNDTSEEEQNGPNMTSGRKGKYKKRFGIEAGWKEKGSPVGGTMVTAARERDCEQKRKSARDGDPEVT